MIRKHDWLFALFIAIAVHAAGFVLFIDKQTDDGAEQAGEQGVEIDLGMIGDLGETEQIIEETAPEPEPEPIVEAEPIIEPQPIEKPKPEPVKVPEPVKPKQDTDTKIKKAAEPLPETKPIVESEAISERVETATEKPVDSDVVAKQDVKKQQQQQKQTTGQANVATSGGQVAAQQSYFSLLAATLAKHKRYPISSRRRGEEGVVKLFFIVNRNGNILEYRISESSGSKRLDEAVIKMLDKASPLPAFPNEMLQSQLEINVPIAFQLNQS